MVLASELQRHYRGDTPRSLPTSSSAFCGPPPWRDWPESCADCMEHRMVSGFDTSMGPSLLSRIHQLYGCFRATWSPCWVIDCFTFRVVDRTSLNLFYGVVWDKRHVSYVLQVLIYFGCCIITQATHARNHARKCTHATHARNVRKQRTHATHAT